MARADCPAYFHLSLHRVAYSASKAQVVVSWHQPVALRVRPLRVDARIREFTLGPAHDVTDRLFVVRRAKPRAQRPTQPVRARRGSVRRSGSRLSRRARHPEREREADFCYSRRHVIDPMTEEEEDEEAAK